MAKLINLRMTSAQDTASPSRQGASSRVVVSVILAALELLLSEAGAEVIVSQTVQDALAKTDEGLSAAILDFALLSETVEPMNAQLNSDLGSC